MASSSPTPPTVPHKRSKTWSEEALNPSFADLPLCLVEVIMFRLVLKDNIRASAACKPWREAAVSVRVVEKHPWLLYITKRGHLLRLCEPLQWKSYTLDLPELAESTVCYSRDGWLLMHRSSSNDMFFFNPFTRELIGLPQLDQCSPNTAFSCPPTSDSCIVVVLNFVGGYFATVSTCHPGATEWITNDFPTTLRGNRTQSNFVYFNDRFCFFNVEEGRLYSFHASSTTCNIPYFSILAPQLQRNVYERAVFLAEKKGELFLMFTSGNEKPMVYKLASLKWQEMTSTKLDGLTFFVSLHNSKLRSDLPWMRNNVYFSRFGNNSKRLSYSFDESRYNQPKKWRNWLELCPPQSLWIVQPKNVLEYL